MDSRPILLTVAVALSLTGCITTGQERQRQQARSRAQMNSLTTRVEQLESRLDGIASAQQDLYRKIDSLVADSDRTGAETRSALAALRAEVSALDAARESDRQAIVAELGAKITKLLESSTASAGGQHGRVHKVKRGETLSEIAAAYGASVPAIVKANNLSNAGMIRVGQELFIPFQ